MAAAIQTTKRTAIKARTAPKALSVLEQELTAQISKIVEECIEAEPSDTKAIVADIVTSAYGLFQPELTALEAKAAAAATVSKSKSKSKSPGETRPPTAYNQLMRACGMVKPSTRASHGDIAGFTFVVQEPTFGPKANSGPTWALISGDFSDLIGSEVTLGGLYDMLSGALHAHEHNAQTVVLCALMYALMSTEDRETLKELVPVKE